jgi:endonuclease YncB( thermonuclease family)
MEIRQVKRFFVFAMALLTVPSAVFSNDVITGKVITVIDGNTLEVAAAEDNHKHKVVLVGIDCPELSQEFGGQAKKFLEKLLLNKDVTVTFHGRDRWGNYLGIVTIGDDDPRIELLKEGLAWTSEKNPNPDLESYRTWAQQKGRGLWKQENPTPPWVYRRKATMTQPKSS